MTSPRTVFVSSRLASLSRVTVLPGLLLCSGLLLACGRPATEKECDEIVTRIAELELRARGAAGSDADEVRATREALRKTTLKECVGRRISDDAMTCVRTATTSAQIVDECF